MARGMSDYFNIRLKVCFDGNEEVIIPMSELPFGTSYWAVKELSPSNYESGWSNYVTFGNSTSPNLTLPLALETTTDNLFVRFEWDELSGSIAYHYQFAYDNEFENLIDEDDALPLSTTARLFNNLLNNESYYFRIRAQNDTVR